MDEQKLKQANDLVGQITRLESYQRRGAESLDQAVLSMLSPSALAEVKSIIDADIRAQLSDARQRFTAL